MALETLGTSLSNRLSGSFGKHIGGLLSKLISSKMPAGFNQSAMRQHLESHWGLQPQRQTSVICLALTLEPSSRLAHEAAGKEWLDEVVFRYGKFSGISLSPCQRNSTDAGASPKVDAASLELVTKEQRAYLQKQFQLLSQHLQIDLQSGNKQSAELASALKIAEEKLNRWDSEFDGNFYEGMKPRFDALKVRRYDSSWNWSRQDLLAALHAIYNGRLSPHTDHGQTQQLALQNRWSERHLDVLTYFHSKYGQSGLRMHRISGPRYRFHGFTKGPKTSVDAKGNITYSEAWRLVNDKPQVYQTVVQDGRVVPDSHERIPFIHIKSKYPEGWQYDAQYTDVLMDVIGSGTSTGYSFSDVNVLVTGAGPDSIGADIVRGLLSGGARVILTTSREPSASADFFSSMYKQHGASGSSLTVVPFNQASKQDCSALIDFCYSKASGCDDLDYILPLAAVPQTGQIDGLESKPELAHRAMLVNLLRLLGHVKKYKQNQGASVRPTNVLLPLSPNHGTFGGDGLYGESKIGLETLLNRSTAENWSDMLNIIGVIIGWTRGTGLMSGNNIVAEAIEQAQVMTFSQEEMAFNILSLMTPSISEMCEDMQICVDLNGGLQFIHDLKERLTLSRSRITGESRTRKALVAEQTREQLVLNGPQDLATAPHELEHIAGSRRQRVLLNLDFPQLEDYGSVTSNITGLQGMIDLEQVIVVVGFSELGPWGSARTRWDMEVSGSFNTESLVEMAWMMGLVQYIEGDLRGEFYVGWIDADTKDPVHDEEFRSRYAEKISNHSGLRFIEPEGLGGYDPLKKEVLQEIAVEEDLPSFEASKSSADAFIRRHGRHVSVDPITDSDEYRVKIKKGAHFLVPKAIEADRFVAGQLPRGWDPLKYGIPPEILSQVDPVVVYALCCVAEALLKAGVSDPAELYEHIHVSELANCLGTGAGSLLAMRKIYGERRLEKEVQNDILQESYLNAIGAWTNMLLLGSSGPIKSPTGTCATAIESLDAGSEAIKSRKAKIAVVGGSDDFQEEMSYEFGNMKATCNTKDELAKGRLPSEMSRPMTTSRAGFVESAGCGVQVITSAKLALDMGLPIYGIVALTQMAGDRIGRSVPAPGQGILTAARESSFAAKSPVLNLNYRSQRLQQQFERIERWRKSEIAEVKSTRNPHPCASPSSEDHARSINTTALHSLKDAQTLWSHDLRRLEPGLSPMRAALATWGLTIDDIGAASFHGTSTKANDDNESNVINTQMKHLGRTAGNLLPVICQKYLTGHTKGAAGALMMNGALQVLETGTIPGNRNADNIDKSLQQYHHLIYPSKPIHTSGVNAVMLTSFGFGQKGGLTIAIAPRYLYSAISQDMYANYVTRLRKRQSDANYNFAEGIMKNCLFKAKHKSSWAEAGETAVFLDPSARITTSNGSNPANKSYMYSTEQRHDSQRQMEGQATSHQYDRISDPLRDAKAWVHSTVPVEMDPVGVGIDTEQFASIPIDNDTFIARNYTETEQEYCKNAADPQASFVGKWSAKEAVFKSLGTDSLGPGSAMSDIEILNSVDGEDKGAPKVVVSTSLEPILE